MSITLSSTAIEPGKPIPKRHTEDGEDLSPPLAWSGLPDGTKQLALICDDPDAPRTEPWVHWVIYRMPANLSSLPQGIAKTAKPDQPAGAVQGLNSWSSGQTIGYRGPAPPAGKPHHYRFRLYALDAELPLGADLDKSDLLQAIEGHILAWGELVGTYQR
jgi:Raf kinase inhibitor-like YbhB/YbcL family protein